MQISQAHAKINLALHITGQREDGYHLLDSLVVFADTVSASDTLILSQSQKDGFGVSGAYGASLSSGADNLVLRARDLVRQSAIAQSVAAPAVHISLEKRLPVASGIGGGSADAATTIKMLLKHWGVAFKPEYFGAEALSKSLGADVPMCIAGRPLHATGIGDIISKLADIPALHLVLVNCMQPVSTAAIYQAMENKNNPPIGDIPNQDFVNWLKQNTRNDMLPHALKQCQGIKTSLEAINAQGAMMAQMSGSGATCFGIFPSSTTANQAAKAIQLAQPDWWVVATHSGASPKGQAT